MTARKSRDGLFSVRRVFDFQRHVVQPVFADAGYFRGQGGGGTGGKFVQQNGQNMPCLAFVIFPGRCALYQQYEFPLLPVPVFFEL